MSEVLEIIKDIATNDGAHFILFLFVLYMFWRYVSAHIKRLQVQLDKAREELKECNAGRLKAMSHHDKIVEAHQEQVNTLVRELKKLKKINGGSKRPAGSKK